MVQSHLIEDKTQRNYPNARWYFQQLKTLNDHSNKPTSKKQIQQVNLSTQEQHISFQLPIKSDQLERTRQKCDENRSTRSVNRNSAVSVKSTSSTTNQRNQLLSEFISNSSHSLTTTTITIPKDEKDNSSDRRSSISTTLSHKSHVRNRLSGTPTDQRCHRIYSSTTSSVDKQTCSILGPQLCSDCIEIQTRTNLSPEPLPNHVIRQRITALALRRFLKNGQRLSDDELIQMINKNEIQLRQEHSSDQTESSLMSDDQYFDHLSSLLNRYAGQSSPYYFKNLNDFARKYQSNKYQRLLLSETPAPTSSNPLFNDRSVEKFDISKNYSYQKRASTIKPDVKSSVSIFLPSNKTESFQWKYRSLKDYSPSLPLQTIDEHSSNQYYSQKKTLIGSKQTLHV